MNKGVKKVIAIVGIAALAVTGIGLLVAPGAWGLLAGVSAAANAIGLSTLLGIGTAALSIGLSPTPKSIEETGAGDRSQPYADPTSFASYVFGTTAVPLALVYEERTGSAPSRYVHDIFAHAWHAIESYQSLKVSTDAGVQTISFTGNAANSPYTGAVYWFRADGTQSAALSGTPFDNNAWPTTAVFKGMAHSALVWGIDNSAFTSAFSALPSKIEMVAEGALLYDPRLDNDYGSGTHEYGDASTYEFNDGNAALVLLRMLIGEYSDAGRLIWGRGASEGDIDMDTFTAMADVCDETRDGIPRYRLGGMWALSGDFEAFVKQWEEETGGKLSKGNDGVYRVWVPHDDLTPLTTISESDLLSGQQIQHTMAGGIESYYNVARGRYVSAADGYLGVPYDDVIEDDAVDEDGSERILTYDFSWVQDESIAQRTARLRIRRSRFQRIWMVPIGWKGRHPNYRPFTVHTLNCEETGNEDQLVRVIDRRNAPTGETVLVLQQEDSSLYDDTVPLNDPLASDTIPTRIDRIDTTPRRIGGATSDAGPITVTLSAPATEEIDAVLYVTADISSTEAFVLNASFRVGVTGTGFTVYSAPMKRITGVGVGFVSAGQIEKTSNTYEPTSLSYQFSGQAAGTYDVGIAVRIVGPGSGPDIDAIFRDISMVVTKVIDQ